MAKAKDFQKEIHKVFNMGDIVKKLSVITEKVKVIKYPDEINRVRDKITQKDISRLKYSDRKGAEHLQDVLNTLDALSERIHDVNDSLNDLEVIIEDIEALVDGSD